MARLVGSLVANVFPVLMAVLIVVYAVSLRDFERPALPSRPLSEIVQEFLWFALLSGLLSMALLEVLKRVLGLRGLYQQRQIHQWFLDRSDDPEVGRHALEELYEATGLRGEWVPSTRVDGFRDRRNARRLFDLPIEQVAAQVGEAAELALLRPGQHTALLACLAGVRQEELSRLGDARPTDLDLITQNVRAGVDALQISVGQRWRTYVRSTAVWVSGAIGAMIARDDSIGRAEPSSALILTALVLGGALAWFSRDVLAAVERLRR